MGALRRHKRRLREEAEKPALQNTVEPVAVEESVKDEKQTPKKRTRKPKK